MEGIRGRILPALQCWKHKRRLPKKAHGDSLSKTRNSLESGANDRLEIHAMKNTPAPIRLSVTERLARIEAALRKRRKK